MVPAGPSAVASRRRSLATPPAPKASMWSRMRPRASAPVSTKTTLAGAARQGLEAERAGAGEEVEHAQAIEVRAEAAREDVEHRLAHAVGGGADRVVLGRDQRLAAELAGDDAHQALGGRGRRGRSPPGPEPRGRFGRRRHRGRGRAAWRRTARLGAAPSAPGAPAYRRLRTVARSARGARRACRRRRAWDGRRRRLRDAPSTDASGDRRIAPGGLSP